MPVEFEPKKQLPGVINNEKSVLHAPLYQKPKSGRCDYVFNDIEKAFRGVFRGDRAPGRLDVACVGVGACALGAVVHNFGVAIGRWPVARWPLVTDH